MRGDAAVHRRLGDRWRNALDQPRIEGLGNQVFRTEAQTTGAIGAGDHIGDLGMREILDLHFLDDAGFRCRHFHRGLVGLDRDQRIFELDGVASLDKHFDDRYVVEVADVRNPDLFDSCHVFPTNDSMSMREVTP